MAGPRGTGIVEMILDKLIKPLFIEARQIMHDVDKTVAFKIAALMEVLLHGLDARAGVRLLLVAPRFGAETETAAAALADARPELWTYTCVRNGTGVAVLLAPPSRSLPPEPARERPGAAPEAPPQPEGEGFRTGLDAADLGLTPAERREFD